ncbi:hypothetical protein NQ318_000986 [Aromia moschata]|uniref:Uncharacterized protein n=1 Tax=Aromia moschata TaxID=1265417 RepID=A0AAV8ZFU9_9CUCU|nr:hypothetical protein NQ318_000986 [Aromia moschata]
MNNFNPFRGTFCLNTYYKNKSDYYEYVPLALRENTWFMYDGMSPHFALPVCQYLYGHFPHWWIGRGSEFVWPPRSPDLNPPDLYAWSNLEDLVRQEEANSLRELRQRIQETANTFENNREILFNIQRHLRRCILKRIERTRGIFMDLVFLFGTEFYPEHRCPGP